MIPEKITYPAIRVEWKCSVHPDEVNWAIFINVADYKILGGFAVWAGKLVKIHHCSCKQTDYEKTANTNTVHCVTTSATIIELSDEEIPKYIVDML